MAAGGGPALAWPRPDNRLNQMITIIKIRRWAICQEDQLYNWINTHCHCHNSWPLYNYPVIVHGMFSYDSRTLDTNKTYLKDTKYFQHV